jgi:hypothetical protein
MAWSGREKARDRDPGWRRTDEPQACSSRRVFQIADRQREQIARSLRHIDDAREALAAQQDPKNRLILRELRASADRIFDILNGLDEIDE